MPTNHDVLSVACLIFSANAYSLRAFWDSRLPLAWLCVFLTSVCHHSAPRNRLLARADTIAVYNLVLRNGHAAAACCPPWVQAYFIGVVAYSGAWYYAAKLGFLAGGEATRLRLHLLMYASASSAGHLIGHTATLCSAGSADSADSA